MNKQQIAISAAVLVVIAGGAFWGGMAYAKGQNPRGTFSAQFAAGGMMGGRAGRGMGGFVSGQIVSADASSITIQTQGGNSSTVVYFATSTQVTKSAPGSIADLTAGTSVLITGTPNGSGSLTAQSIQIRPAGSPIPGGQPQQ